MICQLLALSENSNVQNETMCGINCEFFNYCILLSTVMTALICTCDCDLICNLLSTFRGHCFFPVLPGF